MGKQVQSTRRVFNLEPGNRQKSKLQENGCGYDYSLAKRGLNYGEKVL